MLNRTIWHWFTANAGLVALSLLFTLGCNRNEQTPTKAIFITKDVENFGVDSRTQGMRYDRKRFYVTENPKDAELLLDAIMADISAGSVGDGLSVSLPVCHGIAFFHEDTIVQKYHIIGNSLIPLKGKRYVSSKFNKLIHELIEGNRLRAVDPQELDAAWNLPL